MCHSTCVTVSCLSGGLFLLYKTVKEIHHKLEGDEESVNPKNNKPASFGSLIAQIIVIDMVFSFDSIITAVGLARIVPVMIIAVIIAMIIMFFFADKISNFIHQHPTLKMLALSFLLMVGFSLFFEGLEPVHHSHIDKGLYLLCDGFLFWCGAPQYVDAQTREEKETGGAARAQTQREQSGRNQCQQTTLRFLKIDSTSGALRPAFLFESVQSPPAITRVHERGKFVARRVASNCGA